MSFPFEDCSGGFRTLGNFNTVVTRCCVFNCFLVVAVGFCIHRIFALRIRYAFGCVSSAIFRHQLFEKFKFLLWHSTRK